MEKEIMKVVNKKIRKGIVLMIVLGIVFGGIAGVTAYTISAKEIGYSPKDRSWKVNNVADAIESLKTLKGGSQNYSLDEQVVGTWIDGKPLYQKTINWEGNTVIDQAYKIADLSDIASNIDVAFIVHGRGLYNNSNSVWMSFPIAGTYLDKAAIYVNGSSILFGQYGLSYNFSKLTYTIQYTKTTDNATNS